VEAHCSTVWVSHFSGDAHPSKLFEGVKFRLDILLTEKGGGSTIYSSPYLKWFSEARPYLFPTIPHLRVENDTRPSGLIPKTGRSISHDILSRISQKQPLALSLGNSNIVLYIHRVITMFVKCFDFVPYFCNDTDGVKKSEDYKPFKFKTDELAHVALAVLNSSTFFYWFTCLGDCFHCGKDYVHSFPISLDQISRDNAQQLDSLGKQLMHDVKLHSVRKIAQSEKSGRVEYDEFWPRYSKGILDQIDAVLAHHYGFTNEELDYILNYDIKFRLGADADEDGE
jgi:hypothetical protein